MSLDLANLSPKARNDYILTGRQFSSTDTIAQANFTLLGLSTHGPELEMHGFSSADGQRLLDARDALVAAGGGRQEAAGNKKLTGVKFRAAMKSALSARTNARSVLGSTRGALNEKVDPAAVAAVEKIDVVLEQTSRATNDAIKLADQLDALRNTLDDSAEIKPEAAARGGPRAVAELQDAAAAVRAMNASRSGKAGTPAQTEMLDLLDGIIIALVRRAYDAAGPAAKRLGTPALLSMFELSKLYQSKSAKAAAPAPAPAGG